MLSPLVSADETTALTGVTRVSGTLYAEFASHDAGRLRIGATGEARLFTTQADHKHAWLNYPFPIVVDYRHLSWRDCERDDGSAHPLLLLLSIKLALNHLPMGVAAIFAIARKCHRPYNSNDLFIGEENQYA